jgi:hypothetical protein
LVRVAFAQQSVTRYLKMLRDAPMSGLVKLRCSVATDCEGRLRAVRCGLKCHVQGRESSAQLIFENQSPRISSGALCSRNLVFGTVLAQACTTKRKGLEKYRPFSGGKTSIGGPLSSGPPDLSVNRSPETDPVSAPGVMRHLGACFVEQQTRSASRYPDQDHCSI